MRFNKKRFRIVLLALLVVIGIGFTVFRYTQIIRDDNPVIQAKILKKTFGTNGSYESIVISSMEEIETLNALIAPANKVMISKGKVRNYIVGNDEFTWYELSLYLYQGGAQRLYLDSTGSVLLNEERILFVNADQMQEIYKYLEEYTRNHKLD